MYALILNSEVFAVGRLPTSARRIDNGRWILALRQAPIALQEACGWFKVLETSPPTTDGVHTFNVELINGQPTMVWSTRPYTPEEEANIDAEINRQVVISSLLSAMAANRDDIQQSQTIISQATTIETAPLANNTQRDQAIRGLATGVKVLARHSETQARQLNGLIRLLLDRLDGLD